MLRRETPCDYGPCPYDAMYHNTCEFYCGYEEPEDYSDCDWNPEDPDEDYDIVIHS